MLVVSFYGPRGIGNLDRLAEWLSMALGFLPSGQYPRYHTDQMTVLDLFYPLASAGHDTAIVQLVLQAPEPAEQGWPLLYRKLTEMHTTGFGAGSALAGRGAGLSAAATDLEATPPLGHLSDGYCDLRHILQTVDIFGYTLIYQAMVDKPATPEPSELPKDLFAAVRRVYATNAPTRLQSLGFAHVEGGRLWLVGVPSLKDEKWQAATVYVALSNLDPDNTLVKKALVGREHVELLMPDLIAHKAYFLERDYQQANFQPGYADATAKLEKTAESLLQSDQTGSDDAQKLGDLAVMYKHFMRIIALLRGRQANLQQQLLNYEIWQAGTSIHALLNVHHNNLVRARQVLQVMLEKALNIEAFVSNTLTITQMRFDQQERQTRSDDEKRHQRWGMLLAVIGVALATAEILSWEVVQDLLCVAVGICAFRGDDAAAMDGIETESLYLWPCTLQCSDTAVSHRWMRLVPFVVQLVIVGAFALFVGWWFWRSEK